MNVDENVIYADMNATLVDFMGGDYSVVNAARVSFNKDSVDFNPNDITERDENLIKYLAKHNHWSPFAHTSITFKIKAPIFVCRQLAKSQVGGVWNESSRRYIDTPPEFYIPEEWRGRPVGSMKQGSNGVIEFDDFYVRQLYQLSIDTYNSMLDAGVAPEQARLVLPQSMMVDLYWTGSLLFFHRVFSLRMDAHAQKETGVIAKLIGECCEELFPVAWKQLNDANLVISKSKTLFERFIGLFKI